MLEKCQISQSHLNLRFEDQPSTEIYSTHNLVAPFEAICALAAVMESSALVLVDGFHDFLLRCSECSRYRTQCGNCVFEEEHDVLGMSR